MSEQTQTNNTLVIALVAVAVLLAAAVGVIIWQQSAAVPPVTSPAADTGAATQPATGAQTMPPAGTTGASTTPAEVDPDSATKVPEGTDPAEYVTGYYEACEKGEWDTAYDMLPADKKAGNSPEALEEQVTGYGIESFTVSEAQIQGDSATVNAEQLTGQYGTFVNTWTFTKDGDTWYVSSKAVTGMK